MPYDHSIVPENLNPDLDLALKDEVNSFMKNGYLVLEDAVTDDELKHIEILFDKHVISNEKGLIGKGLLEVDEAFGMLINNPPVMKRIRAILGTCVQLHSLAAIVKRPGEGVQSWHRDGPWPMAPEGTPYGSLPGQINCGYYLDELCEELGPVWVYPGSHRIEKKPPAEPCELDRQIPVYAKPGQVVIFDGWLWHRGGANKSNKIRRSLMHCYQNAWMKSREDFNTDAVRRIRDHGNNELKLLLGGVDSW
jgi:hypothetical protein